MAGDHDPDVAKAVISAGLGIIGRLMLLVEEQRRPITLRIILLEIPIAIGMGVIGYGAGEYIGLKGFPLFAAAIAISYTGPKAISWSANQWLRKRR